MTRARLRYAFDDFMSRGTGALILGLFAVSLVLVLGVAALITVAGFVRGANDGDLDLVEAIWVSLLRTLDPGTMGGDRGQPGFVLAMLIVTLGGIFIVATLIGIISSGIESRLAELRRGRSRVIEDGHTVILGWNRSIVTVVSELVEANASRRKAVVVILADRDKVEMEEEVRARLPSTRGTRIVCRSGSPIDRDDLAIASTRTARAIIVLAPTADDPDAEVIKTLLALVNDPGRRPAAYHIVAEIRDPANLTAARMVGTDEVTAVLAGDLIARITAQTSLQPGLSDVYTELLDFRGDEIYFSSQPALEGGSFGEALFAFEDSCLIGISREGDRPLLNPPMEMILRNGDELILISADDAAIRLADAPTPPSADAVMAAGPPRPRVERTLILGWSVWGLAIVRELDRYLAPGSEITIVAGPGAAEPIAALASQGTSARLSHRVGDATDRVLLDDLDVSGFQHVILLGDRQLDPQRADARTLVTLLHLRDIASRSERPFTIVSEMLDVRNRELADVTRSDDFIVSEHMVSLYLTQVAEEGRLVSVFAELLDADGAEIYLRPIADYVRTDEDIIFATLVEAAKRRDEVAIGYRRRRSSSAVDGDSGVVINPPKSGLVPIAEVSEIIVIAAA